MAQLRSAPCINGRLPDIYLYFCIDGRHMRDPRVSRNIRVAGYPFVNVEISYHTQGDDDEFDLSTI
jgi:hypothetical protein